MLLGRAAASLFWMSRYVERAENMARLADVAYRISLMPQAFEGHRDEWQSTLTTAGCEASYFKKYDKLTAENALRHMLFDLENESSVRSALEAARNNGRAVRTALTRDVWQALNSTWIEFVQIKPQTMTPDRIPGFLDWIKRQSMLFRGAVLGTLLRRDEFFFSQLGAFIERADNTARILDVKYYILLPQNEDMGGNIDSLHWATMLRSVSAHRAYRWVYGDSAFRPRNVTEFLILRPEMPRSLIFCYKYLDDSLDSLAELYGRKYSCHATCEQTVSTLRNHDIGDILQNGLHEFLGGFIESNNRLSLEIAEAYNFA